MPHSLSSGSPRPACREAEMDVVYARCCGLDIHKKLVVACRLSRARPAARKEVRSFGTMTATIAGWRPGWRTAR